MKQDNNLQLDQKGSDTLLALLSSRTKTEAANKLGIERQTLYDRIDKYKLDEMIAQVPKRALQTLQLGSEAAADTLVSKLTGHQGLEAAKEILDRAGVGVKSNTNIAVQVNNIREEKKGDYGI